jgi:hypothetical protein
MNRKSLPLVFLICASLLACNLVNSITPTTANSSQGTPAANAPAQSSSSGMCSNPLYPVKQGVTRTYSMTGLPTGPTTYTETITDVSSDGFTVTNQFGTLTKTAKWNCTPDGLLELQLGGGTAMLSTSSGMQADFTITKSSGVTIPAKVSAGDAWSYSLDFTTQLTMNNSSGQAQGTVNYQLKALGNESVTVPAGTFNAMKEQVTTNLNMQVAMQSLNIPVTMTEDSTVWYAPNVGMVKEVDNASVMGNTVNDTIELQSYNVP